MEFWLEERGVGVDRVGEYVGMLKKRWGIGLKGGEWEGYDLMELKVGEKKENGGKGLRDEELVKIGEVEIGEGRKWLGLRGEVLFWGGIEGGVMGIGFG